MKGHIRTHGDARRPEDVAPQRDLNSGKQCPICERGQVVTVGEMVWQCERKSCNSEFFVHDGELQCRDKPKPDLPSFIPAVRRPWNPAYREVWDTMTHRERQWSLVADVLLVGAVILICMWFAS